MEVSANYMPGDPRLIDQIVCELKSQGIFDQFRKECIADVDTKPAYQNLRQRVEGSVVAFLKKQTWKPDMNKNQVREMLRKNIYESGFLEIGVERIVDQVVNPKINSVFHPKVEDVVYRCLGVIKPNSNTETQKVIVRHEDLLPTDLEAVSPESDGGLDRKETASNIESQDLDDSKIDEDESPPFEPLDDQISYVAPEENSVDSHLSGMSGLVSHESNHSTDIKTTHLDFSNQDSQISQNSSESRLSIVTSEENTKMEICEDSQSKSSKDATNETEKTPQSFEKIETKPEAASKNKKTDNKDNKQHKSTSSSDKHKSRHDKDYKKSKDSTSSNSKDNKDKSKDKNKQHSSSSSSSTSKDRSKDRKDSSKSSGRKSDSKDTKDKEKKYKSEKDKERDKSRSFHDKDKKSSASSKHSSSSSSKDKTVSKKDSVSSSSYSKDKSKSSSSNTSKDKSKDTKDKQRDDKSLKASSDSKLKKDDKDKHRSSSGSTKRDKDKDKKRDKKDDHYSSKDKKNNERRSTDRDSNDGQSSKKSSSTTTNGNANSKQQQKTTQDSSSSSNNSGSMDSGNSDAVEAEITISNVQLKLIKPKFASNFYEAKRLMKIRKQLSKLEKQSQLTFIHKTSDVQANGFLTELTEREEATKTEPVNNIDAENLQNTPHNEQVEEVSEITPPLQNSVITKESWDALEAKLSQEIMNIDYKDDLPDEPFYCPDLRSEKSSGAIQPTIVPEFYPFKPEASNKETDTTKQGTPGELEDVIKDQQEMVDSTVKEIDSSSSNEEVESEKRQEISLSEAQPLSSLNEKERNNEKDDVNTSDCLDECKYLEKSERNDAFLDVVGKEISFLNARVVEISRDIEKLKARSDEKSPENGRKKRKWNHEQNNNGKKAPPSDLMKKVKKASTRGNANKVNKAKFISSTDISPSDSFSLPLSPADSDKSNDKKEVSLEVAVKVKPKRKLTNKASQTYSVNDLYKPRPTITRRNRSLINNK